MSKLSRFGRPPGRKGTMLLVALAAACDLHDCGDTTQPAAFAEVFVSMAGDGDGTVQQTSGDIWECILAEGHVNTVSPSGETTPASSYCRWSTEYHTVRLHAVPDAGSVFGGWTQDCTGTDPDCTFTWGSYYAVDSVTAQFLFSPSSVDVAVTDPNLEPGNTTSATATPQSTRTLQSPQYTWTSSNPAVASIAAAGDQATITALADGTTEITATLRGVTSQPETVTVAAPQLSYERSEFVTVPDAFILDFDTKGNIFVGNTGASDPSNPNAQVREVSPTGEITPFGKPVPDPDVVLVDRLGRIATLGANAVLTAGALDPQYDNNRVTEIKGDGSVTQSLIESPPPLLSNPSALAFLPDGDLLVGNYGNNTVSRLHRNIDGTLRLSAFYADVDASNALRSVVTIGERVYVVTGSKRLTALDLAGVVVDSDIWPSFEASDPVLVAEGTSGSLDGYLVVAGSDGSVWRIDTGTRERVRVGSFTFATPILGLGVSPVDGVLYVMDGKATIWKVTEA